MALIFHDWFATSNEGVDQQQHMIDQSNLFRAGCFGSFLDLTVNVTKDPAMLQWLNGNENRRQAPNENYARELMELFTLGADRQPTPAYTENDIREAAKAPDRLAQRLLLGARGAQLPLRPQPTQQRQQGDLLRCRLDLRHQPGRQLELG